MEVSPQLVEFIKGWEACCLTPYRDQGGLWTIGWGHLLDQDEDRSSITQDEADEILAIDIALTADPVNDYLRKRATQQQFDAFVSFAFNVGAGAFRTSTMLRYFNLGVMWMVPGQFERWNKVRIAGQLVVSDGLTKRRKAERSIYEFADYSGRP